MLIRFVVVAMVALSLLATVGSAQTAAELLQKGIYTQQTAGNVDGAIQIYQQVIAIAGVDRAIAARAQMQLVSAFLQKGDFPGAAREFDALARNYGEQKEVVSATNAAVRQAASMASARGSTLLTRRPTAPTAAKGLTKGTLENGVYRHTTTGTEIRLPAGWSIMGDGNFPGGCDYVAVRVSSGQLYYVWMRSESIPEADIPAALESDADQENHQGTVDGVQGFKRRPVMIVSTPDGCSVAFEFDRNGAPIEYDTFVRTEKTSVYFRSICLASTIGQVPDSLQTLVHATVLP